MARTAEVKRDARIGEAEAKRETQIKEAQAEEERMAARYINDTEIAKSQRDFELKKAAYDMEVNTKVFYYRNLDKSLLKKTLIFRKQSLIWLSIYKQLKLVKESRKNRCKSKLLKGPKKLWYKSKKSYEGRMN